MADPTTIAAQMRMLLGDQSSSFDLTVEADGVKTRFETGTYPIDGSSLQITVNGQPEDGAEVEERTGVVEFDTPPPARALVRFHGTKWRYFGTADLQTFLDAACAEQFLRRTNTDGSQMTAATMPAVEAYPLAINATIKALWALAIDASFDIDIYAPDGVSIPRRQRYRQLMEMIDSLTGLKKDYEAQLNIGLGRIEVFDLRRVSRSTGRLVPLYVEREVEENYPPTRIRQPLNTYGGDPTVIQKQLAADIARIRSTPSVTTVTRAGTVAANPINGGYQIVDPLPVIEPAPLDPVVDGNLVP